MRFRRCSGFGLVVAALSCAPALGQDFVYERLWPAIQQPWYFTNTRSIAIDADDNVFVVDSFNHRIHRYSTDGQLTSRFGQEGLEPGQFMFPIAVATDARGNLYVAETDTEDFRRIQGFDPNATPVLQFGSFGAGPGQFGLPADNTGLSPFDIEVDASGNIWVSGSERIQRFDPDGNFISAIPPFDGSGDSLGPVTGFDVSGDGEIFALAGEDGQVKVFDARGSQLRSFGGFGFGPGEIFLGNDVEIGHDGRIYVADGGNSKVIRFEPDESSFIEWGEPGTEPGQFQNVWRLDFDSEGQVYTVDTAEDDFGAHRVQKFTADGEFLQEWGSAASTPGRFNNPTGVAVDSQGRIFVADSFNDRVEVFQPNGLFLFEFGGSGGEPGQLQQPTAVAIGPDDRVYVAEFTGGRVQRFTNAGQFDGAATTQTFELPGAVAVDDSGAVYVTDILADRVHKFDPDLALQVTWGGHTECVDSNGFRQSCEDGSFNQPRSLTVNRSGDAEQIVVGDYFNQRLQRFDTAGAFLSSTEIEFFPTSIEAASDGNIFLLPFSDSRNDFGHFFTLLDPAGQPLGFWGELGSNPGQLNTPSDLAVASDGHIYLADSLNHRIVAFTPAEAVGDDRAIIVAGGGPFPGNTLWQATQLNANFAYRALAQQGFTKATIQYLSADTQVDLDGNGLADDVDGPATLAALEEALTEWAAGADDVVVYLVDHGGDQSFRMGGTETLDATALGQWVDQLEAQTGGRISVVYDACQSGSFMQSLTTPDPNRIVVASAAAGQSAFFVDRGALSFSSHFWTQVFNGAVVADAFSTAREITEASFPNQTPLLDADGDGSFNTGADLGAVGDLFFGGGTPDPGNRPTIGAVSPAQTVPSGNAADLFADDVEDTDGIARVWAVIRPPGGVTPRDPGDPVRELPRLELSVADPQRRRWEGTFTGFDSPGVYTVTINAADAIGNRAVPRVTTVSVESPANRRAIVIDSLAVSAAAKGMAAPSDLVVQALKAQDYDDDEITYLSNASGAEVDAAPLKLAIADALNGVSGLDTSDLLVSLRGGKTAGGDFELSDGGFSAAELDTALDAVQLEISGTLTVVYDGDQAGDFVPLIAPSEGQNRIVIASAGADQAALMELDGELSFTGAFWKQVELGATVRQAFRAAESFLQASSSPQVPILEDNGNGIGNDGTDGEFAGAFSLGAGIIVAGDPPLIGRITPIQTLSGTATARIELSDVTTTGSVARAAALITPPGTFNSALGGKPILRSFTAAGNDRFRLDLDDIDTVGEYLIAAYVVDDQGQISQPARTRVVRTDGAAAGGFQVNAGISGAWFDPSHNGEGWLVQVLDDRRAVIYWFTYGPNGEGTDRQVWIGAQEGRIEGPNIIVEEMITTAGPSFGDDFDPGDLRINTWGDVTFHFDDCDSGTMYYRGPARFGQGTLRLARITNLRDNPCTSTRQRLRTAKGGGVVDGRMSGAWFDSTHLGEGWLLEILPDDQALSVWFTYDGLGRQQWLIGSGTVSGNQIDFDLMQRPVGAFFGPAFDPDGVDRSRWGTMQFTFSGCDLGEMSYQADDPAIGSGRLTLEPLTKIQGLECE